MKQVKILERTSHEALEAEVNAAIEVIEKEDTPGAVFIGGRIVDIKYAALPDTPDYDGTYSAMIIFEV